VTQLQALGGLELEPSTFTRPKPLLLLAYLALEGAQQRNHLAELFWQTGNRMKSLSMALTLLRQGAGDVIQVDAKQAKINIKSDVQELLEALDKSDWEKASELYRGAFLEGVVLKDWSSELEEWVYSTREYLAERVQYALVRLAEEVAKKQEFARAARYAERAYNLPGLSGTEIAQLKTLYTLLCAGNSLLAPKFVKKLRVMVLRCD
jgi:DNA-binding SARP family transcriptional activator